MPETQSFLQSRKGPQRPHPTPRLQIRKAPSPFPSNHKWMDKKPVARFSRPTLRKFFLFLWLCAVRHLVNYSPEKRENTHIIQAQAAKTCRYFLFTQDSPNSQLEFPRSQILGTALSTQCLEQSLELPSAGAGEETFLSAEPFFFFF